MHWDNSTREVISNYGFHCLRLMPDSNQALKLPKQPDFRLPHLQKILRCKQYGCCRLGKYTVVVTSVQHNTSFQLLIAYSMHGDLSKVWKTWNTEFICVLWIRINCTFYHPHDNEVHKQNVTNICAKGFQLKRNLAQVVIVSDTSAGVHLTNRILLSTHFLKHKLHVSEAVFVIYLLIT